MKMPKADSMLEDQFIVIDPGHGGRFPGAVSQTQLTEAEVNHKVANYLREMLEQAGARVQFTPRDNEDFSVREDLRQRCDYVNHHSPDIFISIHHNATPSPTTNLRQTETYFRMFHAPSQDLARLIHRRLLEYLNTPDGGILPSNLYVLRNTKTTAILGEATYLTNSEMENLLRQENFLRLEAAAYFHGILDYFSKGVPKIVDASPQHQTLKELPVILSAKIKDERSPIDSESISVYLDGKRQDHRFDRESGEILCEIEHPLANKFHHWRIVAQNERENWVQSQEYEFEFAAPPRELELTLNPSRLPFYQAQSDSIEKISIIATVYDKYGNSISDGTKVSFSATAGKLDRDVSETSNGIALNYLRSGNLTAATVSAKVGDLESYAEFRRKELENSLIFGRFYSENGDTLSGTLKVDEQWIATDPLGFFAMENLSAGIHEILAKSDGYIPIFSRRMIEQNQILPRDFTFKPFFNAAFHGKTFVLDAATHTDELIAEDLQQILMACGAACILFNSNDNTNAANKVKIARDMDADFYIILNKNNQKQTIFHYPSSPIGTKLAQNIAKYFGGTPEDSNHYLIIQNQCPTILIQYNNHLGNSHLAIFYGILETISTRLNSGKIYGVVRDENFNPITGAQVILDSSIRCISDKDGRYEFNFLDAGHHHFSVVIGDFTSRLKETYLEGNDRRNINFIVRYE